MSATYFADLEADVCHTVVRALWQVSLVNMATEIESFSMMLTLPE